MAAIMAAWDFVGTLQQTILKIKMAFRALGSVIKCSKNLSPCKTTAAAFSSSNITKNEVTHTGQQWDPNDYRNVRFIDKEKQINPNWGIKLINQVPPKKLKSRVVWCDGGGGPTGHPKVYINLDKPGAHSCGYCGLRFVKEDHH